MTTSHSDKILIILGILGLPLIWPAVQGGFEFAVFFYQAFPGLIKVLMWIAIIGCIWTIIELD